MNSELYECEECGRMFTLEELYPWNAPGGYTLRVCGDCFDDLETEL